MKKDFPAAHSNDTEWFAVDQDGNLALFDAGPSGANPHGFEEGPEYFSRYGFPKEAEVIVFDCDFKIEDYPELLQKPSKFLSADESGMYEDLAEPSQREFDSGFRDYMRHIYLFLISEAEIIPQLAPGESVMYFPDISASEHGLVVAPVTISEGFSEAINQLIQDEKIKGFAGVNPTIYQFEITSNLPIIHYSTDEGGYTYPYEKESTPTKGLNLKDVSHDLPFSYKKLNCRFDEMDQIQLMEIGFSEKDLSIWAHGGWVALDGKVYDFDGKFLGMDEDL